MGSWFIALLFGVGATTWFYTQLSRLNGNADPKSNLTMAGIGGTVVFIFLFTLLKFLLHF